jgi:formylglycine-generating enzyme required for sulfatase activity
MGMKFRLIPPGEFTMQDQYEQQTRKNPSHFSPEGAGKPLVAGADTRLHPVERVTWDEAVAFCDALGRSEILVEKQAEGTPYRLPTETEWEFACRAGTTTKYSAGTEVPELERASWFDINSGHHTHPVGERAVNSFGLYDLHGNVAEWTADGWDLSFHTRGTKPITVNPCSRTSPNGLRVIRGGAYFLTAEFCRSASRHAFSPKVPHENTGIRLALSLDAVREKLRQ